MQKVFSRLSLTNSLYFVCSSVCSGRLVRTYQQWLRSRYIKGVSNFSVACDLSITVFGDDGIRWPLLLHSIYLPFPALRGGFGSALGLLLLLGMAFFNKGPKKFLLRERCTSLPFWLALMPALLSADDIILFR